MTDSPRHRNLQRVGFLTAVPGLVRRLGATPSEVLESAGLSYNALEDPESTIPYKAMGRLVQAAAAKTSCLHFGLELGRQIRIDKLGPIGKLMLTSPTVRAALTNFAVNQHRNAHGGVAYLLEEKHYAFFGYAVYEAEVPGIDVICDAAALAAFNMVGELVEEEADLPLEVFLAREEPADLRPYHRAFGTRITFDAEQTAVRLPKSLLDQSLRTADPTRHAELEKRVHLLWTSGVDDLKTRLQRSLRTSLIRRQVSVSSTAAELGMHPRTLQRRLRAEGLSFQETLGEIRCEFVQQLLRHTRLGVGQISRIVGYQHPSILTHEFTRWTGFRPSVWRLNCQSHWGT